MIQKLWLDANQRCFLVPGDQDLPCGTSLIRTLTGKTKRVDTAALDAFEITQAEAEAHITTEMSQAINQAKEAFSVFVNFTALASQRQASSMPGSSDESQEGLDFISGLLDAMPDELQQDPPLTKSELLQMFGVWSRILKGVMNPDRKKQEESREQVRAASQAQGAAMEETITALMQNLQKLCTSRDNPDLSALAAGLRQIANLIEQPRDQVNLDDIAQLLESSVGSLLGMNERKKRSEEKEKQEYRESARQAIAESLKAHNITPLTDLDSTSDIDETRSK